MTRYLIALLLFASPLWAQPAPPSSGSNLVIMDPLEIDSFGCRFVGRSLASTGTQPTGWIDVVDLGNPPSDPNPDGMLTAQAAAGTDASFTLSPDQGCGTSGCRSGKNYEIRVRPLDSDSNRPLCVVKVQVRKGGQPGGGLVP